MAILNGKKVLLEAKISLEVTEISTDAAMAAVLTAANVGKIYKFVGTTGTYTNGDLYIVEASS